VEIETTGVEITNEPIPESEKIEQTEPPISTEEEKTSSLLPIAIGAGVVIAAVTATIFIFTKRKKK
jgi:hypothetical protein